MTLLVIGWVHFDEDQIGAVQLDVGRMAARIEYMVASHLPTRI